MKKLSIIAALSFYCINSYGQTPSSNATQNVKLALAEVVGSDLFGGSGSSSGGQGAPPRTVDMPLSGNGALSSGVESQEIKVTMQCNAAYDVNVSASSGNFVYTGSSTSGIIMPVKDVLSFMITENN